MRKSTHGFPFLYHDEYGAPLGDPSSRQSSAMNRAIILHNFAYNRLNCWIAHVDQVKFPTQPLVYFASHRVKWIRAFQPLLRLLHSPNIYWKSSTQIGGSSDWNAICRTLMSRNAFLKIRHAPRHQRISCSWNVQCSVTWKSRHTPRLRVWVVRCMVSSCSEVKYQKYPA